MKKVLIFLVIVSIIVVISIVKFSSYKTEQDMLTKENFEFEKYSNKEVNGLDIATVINKAVDKNTKNEIEKDENELFIQNDVNSIEIEIYIKDNETKYKMEQFYNAGTELFAQYYGNIKFKCSNIDYHKSTGKIRYMLFEQL